MAVSLSRTTGTVAFIYWIWDGLDRTIFTSIKFSFPARFVSPFGFLGMLTFITFIILGVSGALLMFYYEPIIDRAWDSVEFINNDVPFGFHIRNIHYHGSNAMVLLAILHMYYQFFSGRYKIRNEILWVTGIILGTVTILEAFTGYDIIFSERAELAISIAASLTNSIPIAGPTIREAMFGSGFHDFVLRFYAQHVFILPVVMLGLMAVHFPRFLVFDVPMVMGITVPEWYLTGLYAFLRTQYDKFVTGVLWPGLFILSLLLVPFIDRYKKFSWKDRPMITAFGITGIAQIMVTTYWGFYIPSDTTIPLVERLVIDPVYLYSVMIIMVPMSFGFSYMMINLAKDKGPKKVAKIELSEKWINWVIVALIAFMVFLNIAAYNATLTGMNNLSLFFIGLILIVFAGLFHVYRYGMNQANNPPPPPAPLQQEKLKALAEQPASTQMKELPDSTAAKSQKELPKNAPKETAPQIKAESPGHNLKRESNLGTSDVKKL